MSLNIHEKAVVGFDRAGDSYERGRPEYPQETIDFLVQVLQIKSASTVIDIDFYLDCRYFVIGF